MASRSPGLSIVRSLRMPAPVVAAALMCFQGAHAGPLDEFAENNSGTPVQIGIARAIQTICPQLVSSFGGMQGALSAPDSPDKDITLRCNELISTAVDLGSSGAPPARSLGYTESGELLAALQQVTGEEIAAQNSMTVRAANSQFSNIAARLGALRLAAGGAGATGPASAFNFEIDGVGLGAAAAGGSYLGGGASADDASGLKRAGFFANGSYNTGDRDPSALEDGFDFDVFTGTLGLDYRFDTGVIGISAGYDSFDADFEASALVAGGKVEATGFSGSLFAMKEFGNFFIDGVATFGQLDYDIERILRYESQNNDPTCQCPDQERTILSESDGDHTTFSTTAGWQIFRDAWLIQPTLGVSFRNYQIDGYVEQDSMTNGGMELRYGDQDIDSLRSVLGLQVSRAVNRDFGVIRPWFTMEWYHEFEDDPNVFAAKYAQEDVLAATNPGLGFSSSLNGCLSCFSIASDDPDTDFGVVGAGIAFVFPNFVQMLFYYEGLVGYNDLTSHAITFNFRSQF